MPLDTRNLTPLLQVYDMPTSVHFYRDLLGFEVVMTSPVLGPDKFHWALLRSGQADLMLNTAYEFDEDRPTPPDPNRTRAHDDTALYLGCPDVDSAYHHLKSTLPDLRPPTIAPYGMKQLYLHDPDGYTICFQWTAGTEAGT